MITESLAKLEDRVTRNTAELERMSSSYGDEYDDFDTADPSPVESMEVTDDDIERELEEIKELEEKKRALEERVTGMEKDLGGLMR